MATIACCHLIHGLGLYFSLVQTMTRNFTCNTLDPTPFRCNVTAILVIICSIFRLGSNILPLISRDQEITNMYQQKQTATQKSIILPFQAISSDTCTENTTERWISQHMFVVFHTLYVFLLLGICKAFKDFRVCTAIIKFFLRTTVVAWRRRIITLPFTFLSHYTVATAGVPGTTTGTVVQR